MCGKNRRQEIQKLSNTKNKYSDPKRESSHKPCLQMMIYNPYYFIYNLFIFHNAFVYINVLFIA